jgi:hypothetical protein
MSTQITDETGTSSGYSTLVHLLSTALTSIVVLLFVAHMLRDDGTTPPDRTSTGTPAAIATGQEKGRLAELQDRLGQVQASTSAPLNVYLVATEADREVLQQLTGSSDVILIAGTAEDLARTDAHIRVLEWNMALPPNPRAVRVIDLRHPQATFLTDTSVILGSGEEWRAWLQELGQRNHNAEIEAGPLVTSVVLVASEEQAAEVQAAIDDANAIRHQMGEPPLRQGVMVVRPEVEVAVLSALGDMDATRQELGLPAIEVIDLQEQAADRMVFESITR